MKSVLAVMLLVMTMGLASAGASWGDGFAQHDPAHYLQNAGRLKAGAVTLAPAENLRGRQAMTLKGVTSAVFHRIPVEGDTKYTLSFQGRTQGSETLEENPTLEILLRYNRRNNVLPRRQVRFFDADQKVIGMFHVSLPFGQWHDYVDVFYTPTAAREVEISFIQEREPLSLQVDDLKLFKTPDEGAINCNPVLGKLGLYNYSGIESIAAGAKMVTREDGVVVFDARYGSQSFRFPILQPGRYELSAKAESNGYASVVQLHILDENNRTLTQVNYGLRQAGKPQPFIMPESARYGRILMRSVLVEEVRLVRSADP